VAKRVSDGYHGRRNREMRELDGSPGLDRGCPLLEVLVGLFLDCTESWANGKMRGLERGARLLR
jgi:hypothetical protein